MLWAMSLYVYIWPDRGNGHTANELAEMGAISITLTIENIILVFLASWMMFIIKDVAIQKDRGYDDNNKQLVYQSITSFKDRYDDIKMRSSNFSLNRHKPSMKRLSLAGTSKQVLGKPLIETTQDAGIRSRTLKKTLMSYNTMRGNQVKTPRSGLRRLHTEMDGIDEDEEEDDFDDYGGGSKIKLRGVDNNLGQLNEYEPLKEEVEPLTENETDAEDGIGGGGDTNVSNKSDGGVQMTS